MTKTNALRYKSATFMSSVKALATFLLLNSVIIAAAVARGISKADKPGLYFGEGRFTMIFSCLQLLAVGLLSFAIFQARRASSSERGWFAPQNLWFLIGLGFLFLTADELLQIHEKMDQIIHGVFRIAETNVTTMIDDFIIGGYLLVGVATLWFFRGEMKRFRVMRFPLVCGFVCGGLSVVSDALAHHENSLRAVGADEKLAAVLIQWADVGDGAFTLLAEGCFVVAFFVGWREVKLSRSAQFSLT
jgi:hypothetical protein